MQLQAVVT